MCYPQLLVYRPESNVGCWPLWVIGSTPHFYRRSAINISHSVKTESLAWLVHEAEYKKSRVSEKRYTKVDAPEEGGESDECT